jgi:hypothetical protein
VEIPCWTAAFTEVPANRRLPPGLAVLPEPPAPLYYPYWALVLTASFRMPLAGLVKRHMPACVDGLTGRIMLLPPAMTAKPVTVPDDRVVEARIALDEKRLADVREAFLPFVVRRLRILATPDLETQVAGLVYKQLLVYRARNGAVDCSLYLDTLSGEWALRPLAGGASDAGAPPAPNDAAQ